MGQIKTLPTLPEELISNIILRSGGVPLLKQISSQLTKLNSGLITEYNMITSPITKDEIDRYLLSKPKSVTIFHYKKNKILSVLYKTFRNNEYKCYSTIECNQGMINTSEGSRTYEYFRQFDQSVKEFVTEYKENNYDIFTTFNIINNRTKNKTLAEKVCLDTFNYYYQTLKDEMLWGYLFTTINIIGGFISVSPFKYRENKHLIPCFYQLILEDLEISPENFDEHYGSYHIKRI